MDYQLSSYHKLSLLPSLSNEVKQKERRELSRGTKFAAINLKLTNYHRTSTTKHYHRFNTRAIKYTKHLTTYTVFYLSTKRIENESGSQTQTPNSASYSEFCNEFSLEIPNLFNLCPYLLL